MCVRVRACVHAYVCVRACVREFREFKYGRAYVNLNTGVRT